VLPLFVPPLRERREEIPLLAQHFLTRYGTEMNKPNLRLAPDALDALMVSDWPGNVRELENEILRLVAVLPAGAIIHARDLSARLQPTTRLQCNGNTNGHTHQNSAAIVARPLTDRVAELEQTAIREALAQADNNITQAAPLLGLTRKGLQLKLKRYHIEVPPSAN
jgi:Nif-specific regulatory protein